MSLKENWRPRIDGVDVADSSAVNEIAAAVIDLEKQAEQSEKINIYGVDKVGRSNPINLPRTDDAIGLTFTADGTTGEIHSDFDNCYPWSHIEDNVTDEFGNVFVKIPKFYSRITKNSDGTYKYQISGTRHIGFSTLFKDGHGNEIDYVLVGKYEGSDDSERGGLWSKSKQFPIEKISLNAARKRCKVYGVGYQQYDVFIDAIIKQLFLVEFATTNSQSVMAGWTAKSNPGVVHTGHTDGVKTSSGSANAEHNVEHDNRHLDGLHACKYRGIENVYGNLWTVCDGICFKQSDSTTYKYGVYICSNPEDFVDIGRVEQVPDGYVYAGDCLGGDGYCISENTPTLKFPLICMPTNTVVDTEFETGYADVLQKHDVNTPLVWVYVVGGGHTPGKLGGLWCMRFKDNGAGAGGSFGSRLCYKPI